MDHQENLDLRGSLPQEDGGVCTETGIKTTTSASSHKTAVLIATQRLLFLSSPKSPGLYCNPTRDAFCSIPASSFYDPISFFHLESSFLSLAHITLGPLRLQRMISHVMIFYYTCKNPFAIKCSIHSLKG